MQIFELIVDIMDILHFPEWPKHMVQEHSVRYVPSVQCGRSMHSVYDIVASYCLLLYYYLLFSMLV